MANPENVNGSTCFRDVLQAELEEVARSREKRCTAVRWMPNEKDPFRKAARSNLVGLAFSGGGIRSATFNLGVLQCLARFGLLQRVDYLSTVSGGGYIGSWFTSWVKRFGLPPVQASLAAFGSPKEAGAGARMQSASTGDGVARVRVKVELQQTGGSCEDDFSDGAANCNLPKVEPDPVSHLRRYSNYLTPRVGFLTADTWTMIAIYVRNLLLNLSVLVLALAGVLLAPHLALRASLLIDTLPVNALGAAFTVLAAVVLAMSAINHNQLSRFPSAMRTQKGKPSDEGANNAKRVPRWNKNLTSQAAVQIGIVAPVFLAAWLGTALTRRWEPPPGFEWTVGGIALVVAVCTSLLVRHTRRKRGDKIPPKIALRRALPRLVFLPATAIAAVLLVREIEPYLREGINWRGLAAVYPLSAEAWWLVWGVPLIICCFVLVGTLYIGLMGKGLGTAQREWWARLGAWVGIYLVVWIGLFALVLSDARTAFAAASGWIQGALASGWLLTTIGGLVAGRSDCTGGKTSNRWMELLGAVAPYVFITGLLVAISEVVKAAILGDPGIGAGQIALWMGGILALAGFLSWRFDINQFSMHNFYRNRLARCYIAASDPQRDPHPFTGFDEREDFLRVSDLVRAPTRDPETEKRPPEFTREGYDGPYHIVNTNLNLVEGEELAWQQRKGQSFVFAPLYSGFGDCYRPTADYDGGLSLGTAMAISGAAASPNMGYHSSKALAFLMTVFNVRLGWWLGNPRFDKSWREPGPRFGLGYLLFELFGLANKNRKFVYLSDGGHFENLGIYELVRRRCRFIIACDGSQDGNTAGYTFEDLGNAIEKCRTDLGVDIEIDVDQIKRQAGGRSQWHCAVGRIRYGGSDELVSEGTLLYLKPALTGDEPADVLRYAALNKEFPHQTTGDQWFNESQFESYRALGFHTVKSVIQPVYEPGDEEIANTERFVTKLRHHWFPECSAGADSFSRHSAALQAIWETLRNDEDLTFLDPQVYPEWQKLLNGKAEFPKNVFWKPPNAKEIRAGFYLCSRIIQLMENVYLDLDLERQYDHPDNRGWINFFRHWSWAGMLRVTWTITASTYGARFQTFCRRRLDLDIGKVGVGKGIEFPDGSYDQVETLNELEELAVLNFHESHLIRLIIEKDAARAKPGAKLADVLFPLQIEVALPDTPKALSFPVGFAWIRNGKLRFFRIQDHLRSMGLGRAALKAFIEKHGACETDLADLPEDPFFPDARERERFQRLCESIRVELGLLEFEPVEVSRIPLGESSLVGSSRKRADGPGQPPGD